MQKFSPIVQKTLNPFRKFYQPSSSPLGWQSYITSPRWTVLTPAGAIWMLRAPAVDH